MLLHHCPHEGNVEVVFSDDTEQAPIAHWMCCTYVQITSTSIANWDFHLEAFVLTPASPRKKTQLVLFYTSTHFSSNSSLWTTFLQVWNCLVQESLGLISLSKAQVVSERTYRDSWLKKLHFTKEQQLSSAKFKKKKKSPAGFTVLSASCTCDLHHHQVTSI